MNKALPSRGDIWLVNLNPVRGHEQAAGTRPALVVSVDLFNHGPAGLVVVLPVTSKDKGIPLHVKLLASEGGLKTESYVKCEDIRSVSIERCEKKIGHISPSILAEVDDRLRILLDL